MVTSKQFYDAKVNKVVELSPGLQKYCSRETVYFRVRRDGDGSTPN